MKKFPSVGNNVSGISWHHRPTVFTLLCKKLKFSNFSQNPARIVCLKNRLWQRIFETKFYKVCSRIRFFEVIRHCFFNSWKTWIHRIFWRFSRLLKRSGNRIIITLQLLSIQNVFIYFYQKILFKTVPVVAHSILFYSNISKNFTDFLDFFGSCFFSKCSLT